MPPPWQTPLRSIRAFVIQIDTKNRASTMRTNLNRLLHLCFVLIVFCGILAPPAMTEERNDAATSPPLIINSLTLNTDVDETESTPSPKALKCCPVEPESKRVITDVVFLIDSSSSMAWPASYQSRLAVAQWCALDVADAIPDRLNTAFVKLEDSASVIRQLSPLVGDERSKLRLAVMQLVPVGGDQAGKGSLASLIHEAKHLLPVNESVEPLIVLVTDGWDCDPHGAITPLTELRDQYGDRLHVQIIGICDNDEISEKLNSLAVICGKNGTFSSIRSYQDLPSALAETRMLLGGVWHQEQSHLKWCEEALECCNEQVKVLNDRVCQLNLELKKCSDKVCSLEGENERLRKELHCCHEKSCELEKRIQRLRQQISELRDENSELKNRNQDLQNQLDCCLKEKCELEKRILILEKELKDCECQKEKLMADKEAAEAALATCHQEQLQAKAEIEKLEKELIDSKKQTGKAIRKAEHLQDQLRHASHLSTFLGILLAIVFMATLFALIWLLLCSAEKSRLRADVARLQSDKEGIIREMAATKKDCCCHNTPAVVYGPGPVFGDKTDQAKADQAKADQSKADQAKVDQAKADQAKADQAKSDQARTDQAKADQAKTDQAKTDQSKTDQSKTDQAKTDQSTKDQAKTKQSETDQGNKHGAANTTSENSSSSSS